MQGNPSRVERLHLEATRQRVVRIPVNVSFYGFILDIWQLTKNLTTCLFEPMMDPTSLIDLSIALLVLERVGANLQPYEPRFVNKESGVIGPLPLQQVQGKIDDSFLSIVNFLGSPCMAVFGTLALVFSCMANSSYNVHSTLLAEGLRMASHTSSVFLLYMLLILFCFETMLVLFIMLVAFHALTVSQNGGAEEHITVLFLLTVAWIFSLTASNFLRYSLYQRMGD